MVKVLLRVSRRSRSVFHARRSGTPRCRPRRLGARRPAWPVGTWAPFIASVELVTSRIEAKVKMS